MTASPTLLEQETAQQPASAARLLGTYWPRLDELRAALHVDDIDGLVLVARGSSDNAARYAQYLWGLRLRLPIALATPSLHTIYGTPIDLRRQAVVAISQSGTSPDVVSVLHHAREQGAPTLAVTNDPDSPLAEAAGTVLDLGVGQEISVAATKTYTASVLAVALLAVAFGDPKDREQAERALRRVPDAMQAAVDATSGIPEAAAVFAHADRAVVVGRGLNLSTAFETALKLTELSGILVAPYSPADLLHGPVGAIGPDVPAVLLAPDEPASRSVLDIADELRGRGAPVIVVRQLSSGGPQAGSDERSGEMRLVELPPEAAVDDWLTPVTTVVPGQLLARAVAQARGVDVDHPGGLSKVTRTT